MVHLQNRYLDLVIAHIHGVVRMAVVRVVLDRVERQTRNGHP